MPLKNNEKMKILVVEQDESDAQNIANELKAYFYEDKCIINTALTGSEALQYLKDNSPFAVLLNYNLPDMTGDKILEIIKKDHPTASVIMVTSKGSVEIAEKLIRMGADEYISKNYGLKSIGLVMEKVIEIKRIRFENQRLQEKMKEELQKRTSEIEKTLKSAVNESRNKSQKIANILEVGKIMSTERDFDALLSTIIRETSKILEAELASLFIYDEKTDELWIKVSEDQKSGTIRFKSDKGIAGHVAKTRKILNIQNAHEHELFNPEFDKKTGLRTKTILSAPLENLQGKLIGVTQVLNKKSGLFTKEDEEILLMLASFAAILIENSILEQENLQRERMSMVGNMANTIIHDLKNPMGVIRGFAEVIMDESEECKEYAGIIMKATGKLMDMTHELLDFSKGIDRKLEFQKTNCGEFFKEIISYLEMDFKDKNIQLIPNIQCQNDIEINEDKILRCIYNISGNARDAMKNGGKFVLDVIESDNKENIIISLSDNGKGMPAKVRETIFEPFVTYGKSGGTGLGMAITKKIIDAHKGTIRVESEEGKGTKFEILLPKNQKT